MTIDRSVSMSQHINHPLRIPFPCEQNNPVKSVAENNMVCFRWLCRLERHQMSVAALVRPSVLGETGGACQRKSLLIWDGTPKAAERSQA